MKKISLIFLLAAVALLAAGCSISFNSSKKNSYSLNGGLLISLTKGETWGQMNFISTVKGAPGNISDLDASCLVLDPSDSSAIYFGSQAGGLFYSYDLNKGWQAAESLNEKEIRSVAVSPDNKCLIYASAGNRLYRSEDCNRTWSQIYFDNDLNVKINYVAVDSYNNNKIYLGNSRGDILKSSDRGKTWQVVLRAASPIVKIVFDPQDSRNVFAATNGNWLFESTDGGDNWTNMKDKLKDIKNANNIRDIVLSADEDGLIFLATAYGIAKSGDGGESWVRLELITSEQEAVINAFAANPKDSKEIYYVTNTAFYSSIDGGLSWSSKKLPTPRAGAKLLVNPNKPNVVYLGVKKLK